MHDKFLQFKVPDNGGHMRYLILGFLLFAAGCSEKNENESSDSLNSGRETLSAVDAVNISGQEVGNGGDAIVCKTAYADLGGRNSGLLDYYEARTSRGWTIDFNPATSVDDRVALAISRLERLDPDRAALYRSYAKTFWDEAQILENAHLPDLPDDGPVSLPGEDCELRQLAIQREPFLPGDKRYVISGKIWAALDDASKAGLILHEIAYREAKTLDHKTSAQVRYLNGMMAGNALEALTFDAYADLLEKTLTMPAIRTVNGFRLKIKTLVFGPEGEIKSGEVDSKPQYGTATTQVYPIKWGAADYNLSSPLVTFDSSGNIRLEISDAYSGIPASHDARPCGHLSFAGSVTFGQDGTLLSIEVEADSELRVAPCIKDAPEFAKGFSVGLQASKAGSIQFLPGAIPTEALKLGHGTSGYAVDKEGKKVQIFYGDIVKFDANGRVDLDLETFDPLVKRPFGTSNLSSGNESSAHIRIEKQTDAMRLFTALENFSKRTDDDGETRYFSSPRQGVLLACKNWKDGDTACDVQIKESTDSYYFDANLLGGSWEKRFETDSYDTSSQIFDMNKNFFEQFPECETCGDLPQKRLALDGFWIFSSYVSYMEYGHLETKTLLKFTIERRP